MSLRQAISPSSAYKFILLNLNRTTKQRSNDVAQLTVFVGTLDNIAVKGMMVVVQRFANQLLTGIVDQVLHSESHTQQ